jgi:hypothetical protein
LHGRIQRCLRGAVGIGHDEQIRCWRTEPLAGLVAIDAERRENQSLDDSLHAFRDRHRTAHEKRHARHSAPPRHERGRGCDLAQPFEVEVLAFPRARERDPRRLPSALGCRRRQKELALPSLELAGGHRPPRFAISGGVDRRQHISDGFRIEDRDDQQIRIRNRRVPGEEPNRGHKSGIIIRA